MKKHLSYYLGKFLMINTLAFVMLSSCTQEANTTEGVLESNDKVVKCEDVDAIDLKKGDLPEGYTGQGKICGNMGQVLALKEYKDGKKVKVITFHIEGGQRSEENWAEEKLHGIQKEWWNNGKLKSEFHYKENEEEGVWKYYDRNGNLQQIEVFENGQVVHYCDEDKSCMESH